MKALTRIAMDQLRMSYRPEYLDGATEEEGLGIALANHFQWDGLRIMRCFYAALEDANFHRENETVEKWIKSLERGNNEES